MARDLEDCLDVAKSEIDFALWRLQRAQRQEEQLLQLMWDAVKRRVTKETHIQTDRY